MIKGKDQTFARDFNMKAILQMLSRDELSCSELADRSGLSKPAMTKITSEMFSLNLIKQGSRSVGKGTTLGRKRVYLSMNPNFGLVGAIDFSTVTIKIRLCDMCGNVVDQRLIPDSEYLTPEILEKVCEELKSMLDNPTVAQRELLALCIAASGMIDKRSGKVVVSPKFKGCADIDMRNFFAERFSCRVEMKNDVNLALLGEQQKGTTEGFSNAIMLYIDSGIGGALLVDDKIVEGARGFAGEIGLIRINTEKGFVPLDSVCSINAMKDEARARREETTLPEKFRFAAFAKAYQEGDPVVREVANNSASILSVIIHDLSVVLDCHKVIISGRVCNLGFPYLEKLRSFASECSVDFSRLNNNGIVVGAICVAIDMAIDVIIERRQKKLVTASHAG